MMRFRTLSRLALGRLALGLAAVPFLASAAMANLVVNGGFESGVTNFTSGYTNNQANCQGPAVYAVNGNAQSCHPSFVAVTPYAGQLMMVVNGGPNASTPFWTSDPIAVTLGMLYDFSAFGTSVYPSNPANLQFLVNGTAIGTLQLTSGTPNWTQFNGQWLADSNSAVLSIRDLDTSFDGNDFAIDEISFDLSPRQPVPEPATLALMGAGLAVLGLRRRQKKA